MAGTILDPELDETEASNPLGFYNGLPVTTNFQYAADEGAFKAANEPANKSDAPSSSKPKSGKVKIWAYIGSDQKDRGDTKSSIGLASLLARMTDGEYVYVDNDMLERDFPSLTNIHDRIPALMDKIGAPDIVIGTETRHIDSMLPQDTVKVTSIAESLAENFSLDGPAKSLSPHHLTDENLKEAGEEFDSHYPDLKRPLIAVFLSGYMYETRKVARAIMNQAQNYKGATIFICPSRRTMADEQQELVDQLNKLSFGSLRNAFQMLRLRGPLHKRIDVVTFDYEQTHEGYNPYMGLLARADHKIVLGDSYSMISEALYTGKTVFTDPRLDEYARLTDLHDAGYIKSLRNYTGLRGFPTEEQDRLSITEEVAKAIIKVYEHTKEQSNQQPAAQNKRQPG